METTQFQPLNAKKNQASGFNLRVTIDRYIRYWPWILLSILIFLGLAYLKLRYTNKLYYTSAQILLKDKENSSPELEVVKEAISLGGKDNTTVSDQVKIIKSRRLMTEVVRQNTLNIRYFYKGQFTNNEVLVDESAVDLVFDKIENYKNPHFSAKLNLVLKDDGFKVLEQSILPEGQYSYDQPIASKWGNLMIQKKKKIKSSSEMIITATSYLKMAESLRNSLVVEAAKDSRSKSLNLSMIGTNINKSKLVINSIIQVYNEDFRDDSRKISQATSDFINNRLAIISEDLFGVDQNLAHFKSSNQFNDIQADAEIYRSNQMMIDKDLVSLSAQQQIVQQISHNMDQYTDALLPANVGIDDNKLNAGIDKYNQLILEKQSLSRSMKEDNPTMQTILQNIADIKTNIKNNLNLYQNTLQTRISTLRGKRGELTSRLGNIPQQESSYRKIARQQQIVESIYLFLLQKREEAEIKAAAKIDALKIIDDAFSNGSVVSPKVQQTYLSAFLGGAAFPIVILYFIFLLDNKVKERRDLSTVYEGPFLGELPQTSEKEYVINDNDRSHLAEAFRIIRGNMNFVLQSDGGTKKILVTSTIPGEGKSFVAINLAKILSVTGKKVLLVGGDMRAPKLLPYLEKSELKDLPGLSNLLSDNKLYFQDTVIHLPEPYDFDLIHSGAKPPNPSELLLSNRLDQLLYNDTLDYDYVIFDMPPVSLVGDAQIISLKFDLNLYVVRANLLDKRLLNVVTEYYETKKMPNLAVVLNGVDYKKGYGYGYGYGYGAKGYYSDAPTSFWSKLFRRN